jgi:hypothetical protein
MLLDLVCVGVGCVAYVLGVRSSCCRLLSRSELKWKMEAFGLCNDYEVLTSVYSQLGCNHLCSLPLYYFTCSILGGP